MKVELLVSEWCATCHQAEKVWREVGERKAIDFAVVDMGQPEGRALATRLRIRSIPAIVIDGELRHVGVQPLAEALQLVAGAPERRSTSVRHTGLGLAPSSRAAILGTMVYLVLAGAFLPFGGLLLDGPARPLPLHLLTLGFLTLLIYGLGEHMLPRFTGNPIRMGAWTWTQQGLLHAGLWALVAGYALTLHALIVLGAALAWLSLLLFARRILPVLWSGAAAPAPNGGAQPVQILRRN